MVDTLVAPDLPTSGISRSMDPRVLGATFGDGYGETTPDGINYTLMTLEVPWKEIPFSSGDYLDKFFRTHAGQKFYWTKPRETVPRIWKCNKWTFVENGTLADVTATLMEQPS